VRRDWSDMQNTPIDLSEIGFSGVILLLGWAAFHQDELLENWALAEKQQELFAIEPLK